MQAHSFPLLCLALAALPPPAASLQDTQADYRVLTNTRRSATNLNVETIRGLAYDADEDHLYAVNTHGSTLVRFDATASSAGVIQPLAEFRTLNNPCALALWSDGGGGKYAFVGGGGTHGVAKQNLVTGLVEEFVELPSEPMDIVIDEANGLAYVSCGGAYDKLPYSEQHSGGVVVQLDLATFGTSSGVHCFIDSARPTFLNLDVDDSDATYVYVAPQLSGNRTTWERDVWEDATVVPAPGLPDDDLFRIDKFGTVTAVQDGIGTLLMNHGRNPVTGAYWVLNVEALNEANHSEPAHRGRFAENRITLVTGLGSGTPSVAHATLDDSVQGLPASADKPASFPFGLAFHSSGDAFVVGSTGDVLRHVSGNGSTRRSFGLPEGSIPRGVLLSPDESTLFVYAWGTNRVLKYDAGLLLSGPSSAPTAIEFDLGADPLPEAVQHGREIWYDADNSFDAFNGEAGKVSCNVCHPRGGLDMLGWELGDAPNDRKDLMVTQSLLGIEDSFPYHWRGERTLSDFNEAFEKLLGGSQLVPDDLADFEAFVFSLQAPANPRQNKDRVVDLEKAYLQATLPGTSDTWYGSPLDGQDIFFDDPGALPAFLPASCVSCHSPESGTNGLIVSDLRSALPTNTNMEVAHLRQLHHKMLQPVLAIASGGGTIERPRGGFGFAQDGADNTVLDLLNPGAFFTGLPVLERIQPIVDTASFVAQFDQGIAPRAHSAVLFDAGHATQSLAANLVAQAELGWIDVAAVGSAFGTPLGLWYDDDTDAFYYAEVGVSPSVTLATLETYRQNGQVSLLFVGLPPGNAFRFAADHDDDELSNLIELNLGLDPQRPDYDDDGLPDGYETYASHNPPLDPMTTSSAAASDSTPASLAEPETFDHVTGRIAKIFLRFSEPVTYDVRILREDDTGAFVPFGPIQRHSALRTVDTLVAQGLVPGFDSYFVRDDRYRIELSVRDLAGNPSTITLPSSSPTANYESRKAVVLNDPTTPPLIMEDLDVAHTVGTAPVTVTVDVDDLTQPFLAATQSATLAPGRVVVCQVLEETAPGTDEFVVSTASLPAISGVSVLSSITINSLLTFGPPTSQIPGQFLLSDPTDADGIAAMTFDASAIPAGTRVKIVVVGIFKPLATPGQFEGFSERVWLMPMTDKENRSRIFVR